MNWGHGGTDAAEHWKRRRRGIPEKGNQRSSEEKEYERKENEKGTGADPPA